MVRRVDQMEESQVKRGRGRPRKTIRETNKKDLEVNELDPNLVYDRILWRHLIHVTDPTQWDKAWLLLLLMRQTWDQFCVFLKLIIGVIKFLVLL